LLAGLSAAELQRVRAEQEFAWRVRLGDLIERHPEADGELRALVDEMRARAGGSPVWVAQYVTGSDRAQQAVQGSGIQVNSFGDRDKPGTRR
jgi:hypothetical protein